MKWRMTADGYKNQKRVMEISKIYCNNRCMILNMLELTELHCLNA